MQGFSNLYSENDFPRSNFMVQRGFTLDFMGFEENDHLVWEKCTFTLKKIHVRIMNIDNELIWSNNLVGGKHILKLGCKDLRKKRGLSY